MGMYRIVYFDLDLRRDDDFSPLIGIKFIPNEKQKIFSLLVQQYGITWSERYKCYILPDAAFFDYKELQKYINIINLSLQEIKANHMLDEKILERERKQSYYTKQSLIHYLSGYINNTSSKDSIILDPAAGTGNLTDNINIPKENIYLVEPDEKCVSILKKKGYKNIINSTFDEYLKKEILPNFTHVIMNPPFKNRLDLSFFNKCFDLLPEHGRIAAITSENSIYEELQQLNYTFNIDFPSNKAVNNFEDLSDMLQEYIDNLHNTTNCLMDITTSFDNTSARAYYILAEKSKYMIKR